MFSKLNLKQATKSDTFNRLIVLNFFSDLQNVTFNMFYFKKKKHFIIEKSDGS